MELLEISQYSYQALLFRDSYYISMINVLVGRSLNTLAFKEVIKSNVNL